VDEVSSGIDLNHRTAKMSTYTDAMRRSPASIFDAYCNELQGNDGVDDFQSDEDQDQE
jgi:hypothetical protein